MYQQEKFHNAVCDMRGAKSVSRPLCKGSVRVFGVSVLALMSAQVWGQETTDQNAIDTDLEVIELAEETFEAKKSRRPVMLEEIVVTAQKRAQGLTDVPLSVTAFSGEKLEDAGIEDLIDLSEYAPNFKMVDGGLVPLVYMRGVGSGSNQGFEMSVGMYSDDIHLGRPFQTFASFLDVERVEVLKGPQSILFGKNAIAGALNITSARPKDYFESRINVGWYTPNDDREVNGYVTGPLGESLTGRLAVRYRDEGGYVKNLSQDRDEPQIAETDLRGTFEWQAADALEFMLKLERVDRLQRGRSYQAIDRGILNESNDSEVGFDDVRDTDSRERGELQQDALTLQANWDTEAGHSLKFVSGYNRYDFNDLFDADVSTLDSALLDGVEAYDQLSQEIRFTAAPGQLFDFIGGVFYQQSSQTFDEILALNVRTGTAEFVAAPTDLIDVLALAGPANLQVVASGDLNRAFGSENQAWSVFGQGTLSLGDYARLNLGLRYVRESKKGERHLRIYQPGTQDPVDPATEQVFAQLKVDDHDLQGERTVSNLLPSISLQYDLTDEIMVYGSATRGAKSGGYDARNNNARTGEPAAGADFFEYDDEVADAYEVGSKMRLLDNTLELNTSLYWVKYADMQVSIFDGSAGFAVTNAGEAQVRGAEVDGRWLLGSGLMINGSVALLDFEWLSYEEGPCHFGRPEGDNGYCDLTGDTNIQAPRWTASLGANYATSLVGLNLDVGVDVNYRGEHHTSADLDPRGIQPGYYKVNSRVALGSPDDTWSLALVGKNLNDELTGGISAPIPLDTGGFMMTSERRRSIGLEARYQFGS